MSETRLELTLTPVSDHRASCVSRVPIFASLSAEEQAKVATYAQPMSLGKGELLHRPGAAVGKLAVLHEGRVKLVQPTHSGRERLLRIAGPGDVVGEHAFLTGERPEHYVEAVDDARLCIFDHDDLAGLVAAYPAIAVSMLRSLSTRATQAEHRLALGALDVPARLADYLLDLPARTVDRRSVVRLPLAKKDVASLLATTPESLSRALAKLRSDGLISTDGDDVILLDPSGLDALATA